MVTADARFYADFHGLSAMKAGAAAKDESTIDEVARQFESLLLQMMLKSMRDASLGESLLDSDKGLFYRDLYDKQLALNLSRNGGLGLTEIIKRQLGAASNEDAPIGRDPADYQALPIMRAPVRAADTESSDDQDEAPAPLLDGDPKRFVDALMPLAERAAAQLGVSPAALLAQAALETGWGGRMIHDQRGTNSHNLFGIKADGRWSGQRARVATLEFEDGVAVRKRADFRAYDSYAESFADYVRLIKASPRYQEALRVADDSSAYFEALQRAGYATDPDYAGKIRRILTSAPLQASADKSAMSEG